MVDELSGKPFTQGYAKVLGKSPNVYKENARKFGIRWYGSVGRAKQSYFATTEKAESLGFKASPHPDG